MTTITQPQRLLCSAPNCPGHPVPVTELCGSDRTWPWTGHQDITEHAPPEVDLHVLDGIELHGAVNVDDDRIIHNISYSIRQGHSQVQPFAIKPERVLLVGGGPSLADTERELIDLYMDGGKIFALNNAVAWCLERNLRPSAQIIVDARPENARFIPTVPVPQMRTLLASQCDPSVWDAVRGRPDVWIWHAVDAKDTYAPTLNRYYGERWCPIGGGTTAAMRGLSVLRTLGYIRYDLFGIDSCWMGDQHHAYVQPENDRDKHVLFHVFPTGQPERDRVFHCAPWHVKQCEDLLQMMKIHGDQFLISIHGDGLLAHVLRLAADDIVLHEGEF